MEEWAEAAKYKKRMNKEALNMYELQEISDSETEWSLGRDKTEMYTKKFKKWAEQAGNE